MLNIDFICATHNLIIISYRTRRNPKDLSPTAPPNKGAASKELASLKLKRPGHVNPYPVFSPPNCVECM